MFTTFGDICINFYFKENLLNGISLGGSNNIILSNLASYYNTQVLGVIGNNSLSNIAISDMDKLGIKHDKLDGINEDIKGLFIGNNITDICPYCSRKYSYEDTKIDVDKIIDSIDESDKIIIDNLSDETLEIIDTISNEMYLDLGSISSIKYITMEELENLYNKFVIINIDAKVYGYLKDKFAIDSRDLFDILNPQVLIIYNGISGCDIITSTDITHKDVEGKIIGDSFGMREAFFAEFIHQYLTINVLNDKVLSNIFIKAYSKMLYVANHIGALSHLIPLNIVKNYTECICKDILV